MDTTIQRHAVDARDNWTDLGVDVGKASTSGGVFSIHPARLDGVQSFRFAAMGRPKHTSVDAIRLLRSLHHPVLTVHVQQSTTKRDATAPPSSKRMA